VKRYRADIRVQAATTQAWAAVCPVKEVSVAACPGRAV